MGTWDEALATLKNTAVAAREVFKVPSSGWGDAATGLVADALETLFRDVRPGSGTCYSAFAGPVSIGNDSPEMAKYLEIGQQAPSSQPGAYRQAG